MARPAGREYAIYFTSYAFAVQNAGKHRVVEVAPKAGAEAVLPSPETIRNGKYQPLSWPLLIYVNRNSLKRPVVQEFVRFYQRRDDLIEKVGMIPLSVYQQAAEQKRFADALKNLRE